MKVPKATIVAICFALESQRRIGAIANGTAAEGVQADVVADGVRHERYQGNSRVRRMRAGEAHGECVVQGQAAVSGAGEERRPQDFAVGDRVHVLENVAPMVYTEQVVAPEQDRPKKGNSQKGRPGRDLAR